MLFGIFLNPSYKISPHTHPPLVPVPSPALVPAPSVHRSSQPLHTTEYEANAFAAHLLLENDEVYALAREGYDVVKIAKTINSDINLMLIKPQEINKLGYDFNISYAPDSRFSRKSVYKKSADTQSVFCRSSFIFRLDETCSRRDIICATTSWM